MNQDERQNKKPTPHEHENCAAERLTKELESPLGAQKLGDEAYMLVKQDLAKNVIQP
jgi:hypothetical protein